LWTETVRLLRQDSEAAQQKAPTVIAHFMKDIQTLKQMTKEKPLDYVLWNDLGMEYKRQGLLKDAIMAYYNGVNAIFENIYLQLKNNKSNDFFPIETMGDKTQHEFWLNRTIDCINAYAKTDGIEKVCFPRGQTAAKLSDSTVYGGLLYYDNEKTRYVLPNFIHTFADCLTWNNIYATYLNNIGVAYAETGDYENARKYFKESIAFIPSGTDYPNPTIGLKELDK
jgi:tetratricopeptide (TPR) repeat protein